MFDSKLLKEAIKHENKNVPTLLKLTSLSSSAALFKANSFRLMVVIINTSNFFFEVLMKLMNSISKILDKSKNLSDRVINKLLSVQEKDSKGKLSEFFKTKLISKSELDKLLLEYYRHESLFVEKPKIMKLTEKAFYIDCIKKKLDPKREKQVITYLTNKYPEIKEHLA